MSCLRMIYAIARLNILGMLSILIEKTERSLRLVGVVAPTPRRAKPQIFNLQSSIFNSGLSGLGIFDLKSDFLLFFPPSEFPLQVIPLSLRGVGPYGPYGPEAEFPILFPAFFRRQVPTV